MFLGTEIRNLTHATVNFWWSADAAQIASILSKMLYCSNVGSLQLIFIISNYHTLKKVSLDRILIPAWWLLFYVQVKISSLQQKAEQLLLTRSHLELIVCWCTNQFKKWNFLLFLMRNQTLNGYLFIQCLVASLEQGRNIIWQVLQELSANWWQMPLNVTGQGNWKLSRTTGGAWFVFSLKEWFNKRWHQSRYTGRSHTKPSYFESCPLILPSDYEVVCCLFNKDFNTGFNYSLLIETQAGVIKASWN